MVCRLSVPLSFRASLAHRQQRTWLLTVPACAAPCVSCVLPPTDILPGQGLYYTSITATWRARNCETNNYGVANLTYGLSPAPCRDCPSGMVAVANSSYSNSLKYFANTSAIFSASEGGFTNVAACVTQDGWGYNGRVAQKCDKGTYNAKNNYDTCKACAYGLTTPDIGAGVTSADCGMGPGFGKGSDGQIRECPIGTYNNETWQASNSSACVSCPTGTTTQSTGSDKPEQCNLCSPGYGGVNCNATCGGTGLMAGTVSFNKSPLVCLVFFWVFLAPAFPKTFFRLQLLVILTPAAFFLHHFPRKTFLHPALTLSFGFCLLLILVVPSLSWQYGPPGRSPTDPDNMECVACSTMTTGYSFEWNLQNDPIAVPAVSRDNASASTDCLSKYAQIVDGSWYLPITPSGNVNYTGINNFTGCLDQCDLTGEPNPCQYVTYDYVTKTCFVRKMETQINVG